MEWGSEIWGLVFFGDGIHVIEFYWSKLECFEALDYYFGHSSVANCFLQRDA